MTSPSLSWRGLGAAGLAVLGGAGYWAAALAAPVNPPAPAVSAVASAPAPRSFADLVQQVAPAVVSIDIVGKAKNEVSFRGAPAPFQSPGRGGQGAPPGIDPEDLFRQFGLRPDQPAPDNPFRASGSGFFISADGYILTNNHVVENATEITVRTKDDREIKARLIGRDAATDLAVIKVDGANFPYVNFEDRAQPRVGDWVVAVGNPFGLGGTATAGIVSALGRKNVSDSSFVDYMQIDAPINRGNSGGPTFDIAGRVVGVNTAIFSPSGGSVGIGFDIPADIAAGVAKQLIAHGKIVRGYIGAQIQDVTHEIAASLGLTGSKGALIADVTAGGPADQAGLKTGDLVLAVNGHDVATASDLTRQVALISPGQSIRLQIRRNGALQTLAVMSGQRPSEAELADNDPGQGGGDPQMLGLQLTPNPSGGLKVDGVRRGSDASRKGLRAGDIIRRAGDRAVGSSAELASSVAAARKAGRKDVLLLIVREGHQRFVPLDIDPAG